MISISHLHLNPTPVESTRPELKTLTETIIMVSQGVLTPGWDWPSGIVTHIECSGDSINQIQGSDPQLSIFSS